MGTVAIKRPNTLRDMAWSIAVLAVVAILLGWAYGAVSFSPGRPSDGQAPVADVIGGFDRAAPLVGFDLAVPRDLTADWQPSSFTFVDPSTAPAGQVATVRGGWLTPDGRFITAIQAAGPPATVLPAELGELGPNTGLQTVDGVEWTVTTGRRNEVAWYRTVGDVTWLITGTATTDQFRTLAGALV